MPPPARAPSAYRPARATAPSWRPAARDSCVGARRESARNKASTRARDVRQDARRAHSCLRRLLRSSPQCVARRPSGPTQGVIALAGTIAPEAGATILSQRADGTILDDQTADATGHAGRANRARRLRHRDVSGADRTAADDDLDRHRTDPVRRQRVVIHGPPHPRRSARRRRAHRHRTPARRRARRTRVDLGCNTQIVGHAARDRQRDRARAKAPTRNLDILVRGFDSTRSVARLRRRARADRSGQGRQRDRRARCRRAGRRPASEVRSRRPASTATVALELISDTLHVPDARDRGSASYGTASWSIRRSSPRRSVGRPQRNTRPAPRAAIALSARRLHGRDRQRRRWRSTSRSTRRGLRSRSPARTRSICTSLAVDGQHRRSRGTRCCRPDTTQIAFPQLDPTTQRRSRCRPIRARSPARCPRSIARTSPTSAISRPRGSSRTPRSCRRRRPARSARAPPRSVSNCRARVALASA